MRRLFLFAVFALTMAGGVASADPYRHHGYRGGHHHGSGLSISASFGGPYGGVSFGYGSPYYGASYGSYYGSPYAHVVRRPIYVRAPVVRYRYYDYYQRPALLAENPRPIAGYLWVPGQWQWNGYEWIWRAGHYQPDPAYGSYDNGSYYNGY